MSSDISSELESFRERWRAEVRARQPGPRSVGSTQLTTSSSAPPSEPARPSKPPPKPPKGKNPAPRNDEDEETEDEGDDYVQPSHFDEPQAGDGASSPRASGETKREGAQDPVSALDHYEKAVERETVGNLGDSLRLYRKAFRMDYRVDQKYKNKHFPAPVARPLPQPGAPSGPAGPDAGHASSCTAAAAQSQTLSIKDLIAGFAGLAIQGRDPEIEGMPQPPCPIAYLPDEILVHILRDVAVSDVADFVRLSRVCRRLAYLVATENQIWRRVCLGSEFGFGGMHYHWQRTVLGGVLDHGIVSASAVEAGEDQGRARQQEEEEKTARTHAYLGTLYSSSWQRMFRRRPRVRFGGCYISTVNYIRSGQASVHQVTWNSPVHIVTYYRYLRFFRDGTALSLLTTHEPADVVYHLTHEAVARHAGGALAHLPSATVRGALRGRWRLSRAEDAASPEFSSTAAAAAATPEAEGDLFVETEGVGKYVYRLDLSLRSSAGRGPRNNKLAWRGFYSYDPLTDDWAEFGLRNDKPFVFSRVRSYGAARE